MSKTFLKCTKNKHNEDYISFCIKSNCNCKSRFICPICFSDDNSHKDHKEFIININQLMKNDNEEIKNWPVDNPDNNYLSDIQNFFLNDIFITQMNQVVEQRFQILKQNFMITINQMTNKLCDQIKKQIEQNKKIISSFTHPQDLKQMIRNFIEKSISIQESTENINKYLWKFQQQQQDIQIVIDDYEKFKDGNVFQYIFESSIVNQMETELKQIIEKYETFFNKKAERSQQPPPAPQIDKIDILFSNIAEPHFIVIGMSEDYNQQQIQGMLIQSDPNIFEKIIFQTIYQPPDNFYVSLKKQGNLENLKQVYRILDKYHIDFKLKPYVLQ